MSLTKGQKKLRDREIEESKTVCDPERIAELLESRFVDRFIETLLSRTEVHEWVLPWWKENRKKLHYPGEHFSTESLYREIASDDMTDEELVDCGLVEYSPRKVLRHPNCGDECLKAILKKWSDSTSTAGFVNSWKGKDAALRGTSTKAEEEFSRDVDDTITLEQLKRMMEISDITPPPLVESDEGYYSGTEVNRRELLERIKALDS